jgi:hypothetical protein
VKQSRTRVCAFVVCAAWLGTTTHDGGLISPIGWLCGVVLTPLDTGMLCVPVV